MAQRPIRDQEKRSDVPFPHDLLQLASVMSWPQQGQALPSLRRVAGQGPGCPWESVLPGLGGSAKDCCAA